MTLLYYTESAENDRAQPKPGHLTKREERYLKQHVENASHSSTKLRHVVENIMVLATNLAGIHGHIHTRSNIAARRIE
jgi:5-bromo-4-chloroindolyl phosphate hydrolysis protein